MPDHPAPTSNDSRTPHAPHRGHPAAPPPAAPTAPTGEISAWTIPLMCAGIAIIAACLIIPSADENRRLVYEREKLKIDLDHIEKQVAINEEFLRRVADDPTLLERLAQRQMKMVREGTNILELKAAAGPQQEMSPYPLVTVPPPDPLPPYQATGGRFANFCRHPRSRLILLGSGLLLIATGLVLGHTSRLR